MERLDEVFVSQIWWYTSRASGVVAWLLLSTSVLAGLAISTRTSRSLPAGWTLDLHRFLSTVSLLFLSIHMVALVPDNFIYFAWAEILVPYGSEWRAGPVAWGIVAFWLLLIVEVSSLVRTRIPTRLWRTIHYLSFVVWALATVHLLYAGSDVGNVVFRIAQVLVVTTVVTMTIYRIVISRHRRSGARLLPVKKAVDVDEVDSGERRELATRRR